MKVLLVSHGYPPVGVAGVERITAQTAAELSERGHQVTVLTRDPSELPETLALRRDVRDGIPVHSIVGGGSTFARYPGYEPTVELIFERVLAEIAPDVVVITHLLHHSPGYVEVAHRWRIPVVLELHDFFVVCPLVHLQRPSGELCAGPEGGMACARHCFGDQEDAELRWALRSQAFGEALRAADGVIAPSPFVVETIAAARGEERPITVVENGVAPFGPVLRGERDPRAPLRIVSIGVTVEHKGFRVVVEALRLARLASVSYTILGVALPPLALELQEAAEAIKGLDLRLANSFTPHHLPVLLADADVVVVPSLVPETFSIVAREAFACGVPVIASRLGALPDAIRPDENGWLFTPGDAPELALLLRRLDEDPEILRRVAAGIRPDDVVSFAARTDRVEALLAAVVERGASPAGSPDARETKLMLEGLAAADARARDPRAALG